MDTHVQSLLSAEKRVRTEQFYKAFADTYNELRKTHTPTEVADIMVETMGSSRTTYYTILREIRHEGLACDTWEETREEHMRIYKEAQQARRNALKGQSVEGKEESSKDDLGLEDKEESYSGLVDEEPSALQKFFNLFKKSK
jgi:hypothetical protein